MTNKEFMTYPNHNILLGEFTQIVLDNGISVVNFSSAHPYKFETGEILPPCTLEVAHKYKMKNIEITQTTIKKNSNVDLQWTDVTMNYGMTKDILTALDELTKIETVDIILVPFILVDTIKVDMKRSDRTKYYFMEDMISKVRTCKKVDPRDIRQGIKSDMFCI
mgnify:CR=1 FL=1